MKTKSSKQVQLSEFSCLFVDNDKASTLFRNRIQELFKRITFVESFKKATLLLSNEKFDFIFINIDMSEVKQINLPSLIKEKSLNSLVRIIAITTSTILNIKTKLIKAGYNDYIRKPFNSITMVYVLKRLISNKAIVNKTEVNKSIIRGERFCLISDFSCLYLESYAEDIKSFGRQFKDLKNIFFANNLKEVVDVINTESIDFIVVNINLLQNYNGLEVVEVIRKKHYFNKIPIIAVSACPLSDDYKKIILNKFNYFIQKPLILDKFVPVLKNAFL